LWSACAGADPASGRLGGPADDIPEDLSTLYYCCSELNVEDKVPSEAFELNNFEDSDADYFLPPDLLSY
jgi:hypothetical protein